MIRSNAASATPRPGLLPGRRTRASLALALGLAIAAMNGAGA